MNKHSRIYLLSIFLLTILLGCRLETNKPDIERAISDLTDKFTQLPKGKAKQSDFYRLIRTVTIGEKNIQLQLRSSPENLKDPQQIIIIINPKGQYYAIPFFSNTYRDYWNFQFDKPIPNIKKTNTTFEKEFITAINTLNLNDTLGTGRQIFYEILISLINCEIVSENESLQFAGLFPKENNDLPAENWDSCFDRFHKNFEAIKKGMHPSENFYYYNAYYDKHNERIYQINHPNQWRGIKFNPQIKVYRQDCISLLLDM